VAIKQHFNQKKYDIFEKGVNIRATQDQLDDRNDRLFFYTLSDKYLAGDLLDYMMSNILANRTHPSEMEDVIYREYKSRMATITYLFEQDLKFLMSINKGFRPLFRTSNGNLPVALQALNGSHITLETICIINKLTNSGLVKCFDNEITEPLVYKGLRLRIVKYEKFIKCDYNKLKLILDKYNTQ
jgi:hypothetical protein